MMRRPTSRLSEQSGRRRVVAAALAALVAVAVVVVAAVPPATPAYAAGTAQVAVNPGTITTAAATTLTLRGTGFQSVANGFGGIYVLFGSVDANWRPSGIGQSQKGQSGIDYLYVPDQEDAGNHGYQKFVAFPGDSTAASANGGFVAADGTWSTTLVVPGPVISVNGREGAATQVDCRSTRCGVITIGAHGVVNGNNETFTPVTFAGIGGAITVATPVPDATHPGNQVAATPKAQSAAGAGAATAGAAGAATGAAKSSVARAAAGTSASGAAAPGAAATGADPAAASDSFYSLPGSEQTVSSEPSLASDPVAATTNASSKIWLIGLAAILVVGLVSGGLVFRRRIERNRS